MASNTYRPEAFGGKKEAQMIRKYYAQRDDARQYFERVIQPRLDRSYKLYIAFNGDRAREIDSWQANIFVPYIHSVVETLMPRILDARPEFTILGRTMDDQQKTPKLQQLADYTWEKAEADKTAEKVTRSALVYGSGFLQVSWKKDVRELEFLNGKDLSEKKYKWEKQTKTYYDAPYVEWVDNYSLWYDWHNADARSKQYWFKRLVLSGAEIKRRYPMAEKRRLDIALEQPGGNLEDYASIRQEVKLNHKWIVKGADRIGISTHGTNIAREASNKYSDYGDTDLRMYEVLEWWRPFDDKYAVMVSDIPILKGGCIPNPYNFKEAPFVNIPYLLLPGEFEGYGIPMILENPQIMLNMVKNQRLDAATLNIHKMWVVNPLANINKEELVTRPFGIVYSPDPQGVREIQFSDIKASAYKEEELLKGDMRYASGVDDFSMGVGGAAGSATEVRHLRESTLERVRLFVNHLGEGFGKVMRYWMSMYEQFYTEEMVIRVTGDDGKLEFPLIEKDDLMGEFDYKAAVIPAIAGMQDVKKKQDMDLFQLLINLPFIDPRKLTQKVLFDWNWNLDSITAGEEQGPEQMSPEEIQQKLAAGEISPEEAAMMMGGPSAQQMPPQPKSNEIPPELMAGVDSIMGGPAVPPGMRELAAPINLLEQGGAIPPTAAPMQSKGGGANPRGLNRGGNVNTNIPIKETSNPESQLMNRAFNIQR